MLIMTTFRKQFGKRLKELRTLSGLSQAELSEKIGISEKVVSYWENGHNAVTFGKLPLIAEALNVPVFSLFIFDDDIDVTGLGAMTDKDKRILEKVIKLFLSR